MANTKPKAKTKQRKTAPRPRSRKRPAASPLRRHLPRVLFALSALVVLVIIAAVAARHYIPSKPHRIAVAPPVTNPTAPITPKASKPAPAKPRPAAPPKASKTPTY